MKLNIVAFGNPWDKSVWSGTATHICEYFQEKEDNIIETIDMKKECARVYYQLCTGALGKLIYRRGTLRDPLLYNYSSNQFARLTNQVESDVFLIVAEHSVNHKKKDNARYYVYLDSLLRPHHIYDERKLKFFSKSFLKRYEVNDRRSFNEMNGIFTQNQWSKNFLISEYHIPESKIHNVGFGINIEYYIGEKNYSNHQMMIVLRKGTEYIKGLYLLLEAFQELRKKIKDAKLAVIGTELEAVEGVTYYNNQPREKTLELYAESSLYVMPNILEPNGITYLEALASKTPIVGLNRFSVPEFTGYGEYGFYAESTDPLELSALLYEAFSDTLKLEQMGRQGQEFVKRKYNWDTVLGKIEEIIESEK